MRQTEITNELMDVIIGFEALQKTKKPQSRKTAVKKGFLSRAADRGSIS